MTPPSQDLSPLPLPHALRLGLMLAAVAIAAGCGTTQVALPVVPPDAPLRYSTYGEPPGRLRGEEWAMALMGHPSHREQVFLQAQQGLYPASEVWPQLESVCRGAGALMAQHNARPACVVTPQEFGCELNWNPVRVLVPGEGPGRERLLDVYQQGYEARWEQIRRRFHAQAETAGAGMLMAGAVLGRAPAAAESKAAAAEGRAAAAEGGAAAGEGQALGAEARAVAAEAGAAGARASRLLSAETLGLSRALSAEEATALEARLLQLEAESAGAREAFSAAELRSGRLSPRARPADVPEAHMLWSEFEAYRQRRFVEVRTPGLKGSVRPPLRWADYQALRERFKHSIQFESNVGGALAKDVEQPIGSRRVFKESRQPLLARRVGTKKRGSDEVLFPDYLAVDNATLAEGHVPRVDTFSVKQRNLRGKSKKAVENQVTADLQEALSKYGGWLEVRRPGHPLFGRAVQVSRVHLVYEARGVEGWQQVIQDICNEVKVEVHFQ